MSETTHSKPYILIASCLWTKKPTIDSLNGIQRKKTAKEMPKMAVILSGDERLSLHQA